MSKKPIRDKDGVIHFKDYPEFVPNLTPKEIFQMGSFGGTYFRPIKSSVTNKTYRNQHLEFPKNWYSKLDTSVYITNEKCEPNINKYKVRSGLSLLEWEKSGWITHHDPYGWFQWYCRFYQGRRCPDDERQIIRWVKYASEKSGRWRRRLINQCLDKKKTFKDIENDITFSPVIRQGLQHWGYMLNEKDFKKHRR